MNIRTAETDEKDKIRRFYNHMIELNEGTEHDIGWKKDVYPAEDLLTESLQNGELYIGENDGHPVAAMILNGECPPEYDRVQWKVSCSSNEVLAIHVLSVTPEEFGKGYAKDMVRFAVERARQKQCRAIRLDVIEGNEAAAGLYLKEGFEYIEDIQIYYEVTGTKTFRVFEYPIL